jgi:hypothetical protein
MKKYDVQAIKSRFILRKKDNINDIIERTWLKHHPSLGKSDNVVWEFEAVIDELIYIQMRKKEMQKIQNRILYKFKYLYFSLKYKKKFKDWLWERVRLPKIKSHYHPNVLGKMLVNINDDNEEEFDKTLNNW